MQAKWNKMLAWWPMGKFLRKIIKLLGSPIGKVLVLQIHGNVLIYPSLHRLFHFGCFNPFTYCHDKFSSLIMLDCISRTILSDLIHYHNVDTINNNYKKRTVESTVKSQVEILVVLVPGDTISVRKTHLLYKQYEHPALLALCVETLPCWHTT